MLHIFLSLLFIGFVLTLSLYVLQFSITFLLLIFAVITAGITWILARIKYFFFNKKDNGN